MAVVNRPATNLETQGNPLRSLGIVISQDRNEFNVAIVQPGIKLPQIGFGPETAPRRLDQITRNNQAINRMPGYQGRQFAQGFAERVGRKAVAPRSSGPLVTQVDISDHRNAVFHVKRSAFRDQDPPVGAGDHGDTNR